jgi:type VI secretion system protein ImpG
MDDPLYQDFLDEQHAMRAFFAQRHGGLRLDRADPDVQRLVETMAFFTAHTRRLARRNLEVAWQRLLALDFAYLLDPLPAMAMLQASGAAALLPAARTLPLEASVQLANRRAGTGLFRTTRALDDLRLGLTDVAAREPRRVVLAFEAGPPRHDAPGAIDVYLDDRGDYPASLALAHGLRRRLRAAQVIYRDTGGTLLAAQPCRFSVAEPLPGSEHPLARLRSFFHFPAQELYLRVEPPPCPVAWRQLRLVLELAPEAGGTRPLALDEDTLRTRVVPIANLSRQFAQPIRYDATRSADPLVPMIAAPGLELCSLLGVYELADGGLVPLRTGALGRGARAAGVGAGYELERVDEPDRSRAFLGLRLPEAFDRPLRVAAEALWYQPRFSEAAHGELLTALLPDRHIENVSWWLRGALCPADVTSTRRPLAAQLELFGLRARPALGLDDLLVLLDFVVAPRSHYRPFLARLSALTSELAVDFGLRGTGVGRRYTVTLAAGHAEELPLYDGFLRQLRALLAAWSSDAWVEVAAVVGDAPFVLVEG